MPSATGGDAKQTFLVAGDTRARPDEPLPESIPESEIADMSVNCGCEPAPVTVLAKTGYLIDPRAKLTVRLQFVCLNALAC